MKALLMLLNSVSETYEVGVEVRPINDAWIAEWAYKPTLGDIRAARGELRELLAACKPFVQAWKLHAEKHPAEALKKLPLSMSVREWERLCELVDGVEV